MLSDALLVLLPSVGFAQCVASIFLLIVFLKVKRQINVYMAGLAIADFLAGVGAIYASFFGIYMTIYGETEKEIKNLQCLIRGFFITIWMHSDAAQVIFLIVASVNHLAAVLVPAKYAKASSHCNGALMIALLLMLSATLALPMWISAVKEQSNSSVSAFCPLPDVIGDDIEEMHLRVRIWAPICSLAVLSMAMCLFLIRQMKQSWRYAINDNSPIDKQHFTCVLIRAILCVLSVNLPFMFIADKPINSTLYMNRDYISRLLYGIGVCVCQPLIYFVVLATFREDISLVFKRYSHNTKRQWISADDPPVGVGDGIATTVTQFGSWYSSAGNIIGEAGLPLPDNSNKERSISFYDSPVNTNNPSISNAYRMSAMRNAMRAEK